MPESCILDPQRDCLGLLKAQELERDLNELRRQNSASHERVFDRLAELEKQEAVQAVQFETILEKLSLLSNDIAGLKAESKRLTEKLPSMAHQLETLEGLSGDVDEIKAKPAKRWEGVVEKVIGLVVAALVGMLLARMGL